MACTLSCAQQMIVDTRDDSHPVQILYRQFENCELAAVSMRTLLLFLLQVHMLMAEGTCCMMYPCKELHVFGGQSLA